MPSWTVAHAMMVLLWLHAWLHGCMAALLHGCWVCMSRVVPRTDLHGQGVHPVLLDSDSGKPSACALCWVTPDGQRTMRTCLGASLELLSTRQLPAE